MWLGEQISERGVGNGMSLIIFTGIVVGLPNAIANIYQHVFTIHDWGAITLIVLIAMMIAVVALSYWWSAASAGFRCSTPSAWWAAA
jgi:preprotein translocase subunit SecY